MLYGFQIQCHVADTIRSSIGITMKSSMYANLCGCTLEEIYVLLSRPENKSQLEGIHLYNV